MENSVFSSFAQFGFSPVNQNFCVGTWRNYAVALQRFSGRAYYVYLAIRVQKSETKALKKSLVAAIKASGIKKSGVNRVLPNFIHGFCNFPKDADEAQSLSAYLETLTAVLAQNGVAPANTCAVTGAANPDSLCLIADPNCFGYQPVCGAAVRQNDYEVQAKAEENENNGSYLTGFIGALLGMLVGVAVNLLTMVFLERIFALLFALVPVAAMFGYKLFKGKTDKVAIVIVVVLSILAVPLMEYLEIVIGLTREYGVPLSESLKLTGKVFFDPDVLEDSLPEMGKLLLFMALGVFIGWSYMRSQLNSTQVQGSKLQLDSMRPNPNYQAGQMDYAATEPTFEIPQQES